MKKSTIFRVATRLTLLVLVILVWFLSLGCQQEDDPPPPQIIYETTEQPQQDPETITVVLVEADKSPPQLMRVSVKGREKDVRDHEEQFFNGRFVGFANVVDVGKINRHGLVFEFDEPLDKDSQAWIQTEVGDDLKWDTIVEGKIIKLRPVDNKLLRRDAFYLVTFNVSDLSGNAGRGELSFFTE